MQLPALPHDAVIQALGWTFVHSLWQGLLLAVLAGGVVLCTKKARAGLRYTLLVTLVSLFLCATGFTFVNGLYKAAATTSVATANVVTTGYPASNELLPVVNNGPVKEIHPHVIDRFTVYFNTHAPLIVIIWFIIFSAKLVRLMASLGHIQRIRHYKTMAPSAYWKEKIQQLADELQIRRRIQLLQSEIVQVPVVIGVLKPVILIPLGILSQLPPEQVEAILLHELAHIKRKDYLVNLLQSLAETIFFFNPAVLWVSSLIRDERENCCDDIAIAGTKNKAAFVNALISFQEYNISISKYGMAFPGRTNHLLNRVKRILHEKNKTLNTMEKSLLTFSVALILLLTLTTARQVQAQADKNVKTRQAQKRSAAPAIKPVPDIAAPVTPPLPSIPDIESDDVAKPPAVPATPSESPMPALPAIPSVPPTEIIEPPAVVPVPPVPPVAVMDTIVPEEREFTHISRSVNDDGKTKTEMVDATDRNGKTYKFTRLNDVITSLSVNGVEIPKEQYADYQPVLERLYRQSDANREKTKIWHKEPLQLRQESIKQHNEIQLAELENKKWVMKKNAWQHDKVAIGRKAIGFNYQIKVSDNLNSENRVAVKDDVVIKKGFATNELKPAIAYKNNKPAVIKIKSVHNDADDLQYQKDLLHALIANLVKDGIIKNEKKLESMGLNDTQLIVNGKMQPAEIQQKYHDLYITHTGFGLFYGPVQMTGKGYFLGKDDF